MNTSEQNTESRNKQQPSLLERITLPNTDKFFYDNVVDPLSNYFANIHPNYITLFGLPFSFIVYMTHWFLPLSFIISYCFMMLRTLCDLLDGHTARKYNKETVLGACLDTLADAINAANVVTYFAIRLFDFSFMTCVYIFMIVLALILAVTFKTGILFDHSILKQENTNFIEFLFAIGKYNMVLQVTAIYVVIWFLLI